MSLRQECRNEAPGKIKGCAVNVIFLFAMVALSYVSCTGSRPDVKLDPESKKFYETARLLMTKEEARIFSLLRDKASRTDFIQEFWEKRDPDPDTPENEFKIAFENRVEYASRRFREGGRGWDTDRGRVYIFMGPPDKVDEIFNHDDPQVRGSILIWIYYNYQLGIEFVDTTGYGQYRIRRYDGDFFGAMDILKLGQLPVARDVFKKRIVKFEASYNKDNQEIIISLPANDLVFKENEEGGFYVEFNFRIYVYGPDGHKLQTIIDNRTFETSVRALDQLNEVVFKFKSTLSPGKNYLDIIIEGGREKTARIRRIFEIKV